MSTIDPTAATTLTVVQAAEFCQLTPGYLHNLRHNGKGPPCERISGRVFYRRADVEAWNSKRLAKKEARAHTLQQKAQDLARKAQALRTSAAA